MLNLKTLTSKPLFSGSFTRKILSKTTVRFDGNPPKSEYNWHRVDMDEEMRPDLISKLYYGTENYVDILCKYNSISNPFSLVRDQLIKIPLNPDAYFVKTEDIVDKGSVKATPNLITANQKDSARLNYLKNLGTGLAQPNLTLPNDKNIKVQNGKVIFGADVTKINKEDCPTPISRSNVVKNLIESKIFK
jgi:restriction endonuclease S subunit